jgi:hypothetical protein
MSPSLLDPHRFAGFVATDLPNLWNWVRSDQGVYSDAGVTPAVADDPVQQWNDLSGNGRHFTQATANARPIYKTNVLAGFPGLRFGLSLGGLDNAESMVTGLLLSRPLTVGVVYNYRSTLSGGRRVLAGSNNWLIGPYTNQHAFFGGGGFVTNTGNPVTQNVFVAAVARQSGTNGVANFYINGVDVTVTPGNSTDGPGGNFTLGAANPFGEPHDGDVVEVLAYSDFKSDPHIAQINGYFQSRYALW